MAEIMASIMKILVARIIEEYKEEFKLLWRGLRYKDIEFLKMELRSINSALCLVGVVPPEQLPQHLKDWADLSREVSYDIQDILDTFLVRVEEPADRDGSQGFLRKIVRITHYKKNQAPLEIARAIRGVKILVHGISRRRARYADRFARSDSISLQDAVERGSRYRVDTVAANPAPIGVDDPHLVGTERQREELIRLIDIDHVSNKQLKVVSIVGMGGLGKTTLAKIVYQEFKSQFDCSAWVCLSLNPNMWQVFNNILRQLDEAEYRNISEASWDEERLTHELQQFLHDKRYLIVIDDIWDVTSWQTIMHAMVDNNTGSRIITTTRKDEVAAQVGGVYRLQPLSDADSKKLLYETAFADGRKYLDHQLDETSNNILKKCDGHPLAIVTIGKFLASKPAEYWYRVTNFLDSGLDDNDHTKRVLRVAYNDLPFHLRTCFVFISVFPDDYEFRRDRLIWRWIAEDFVQEKQGCCTFQVGVSYLGELINRNMIEEIDKDDGGGMVKYCRVHSSLLDFASFLAYEENFVTKLVDKQEQQISSDRKVRRLSLQNRRPEQTTPTMSMSQVRSVTSFGTGIELMPPLSSFKLLRVMDLEGCDLRVQGLYSLKHIGDLLHLRYLGLRGTRVAELRKEIGRLRFLQVLDLKGTQLEVLPSTIAQMRRLVCLHLECNTRLPQGIGNLTSLEEMSNISIRESPNFVKEMASLMELRVLDITLGKEVDESLQKDFVQSLRNLHKLQTLGIYGHHFELDFMTKEGWAPPPGFQRFIAVDGWFSVLPTWIRNAENLSELQIGVTELWREGLQSLGRLRELRFLRLAMEHMGERLAVDADAFPNLTQLRLSAETCLVFRRGAMPKLQVLEFVLDVDKANGDFSWGLTDLPSLQKVTVNLRTGNSASANKEAEAALRDALDSHPNHPKLEVTMVTAHQDEEQIKSVDDGAGNVASSAEIQEERYAL